MEALTNKLVLVVALLVACRCIKSLTSTISGLDVGAISSLPDMCGASVPVPIGMSTDCDK
jgi:hypothetical protein